MPSTCYCPIGNNQGRIFDFATPSPPIHPRPEHIQHPDLGFRRIVAIGKGIAADRQDAATIPPLCAGVWELAQSVDDAPSQVSKRDEAGWNHHHRAPSFFARNQGRSPPGGARPPPSRRRRACGTTRALRDVTARNTYRGCSTIKHPNPALLCPPGGRAPPFVPARREGAKVARCKDFIKVHQVISSKRRSGYTPTPPSPPIPPRPEPIQHPNRTFRSMVPIDKAITPDCRDTPTVLPLRTAARRPFSPGIKGVARRVVPVRPRHAEGVPAARRGHSAMSRQ